MRKLILILALATCASAGDDVYTTGGRFNGRWWITMTNMRKLDYLSGYADALGGVEENWDCFYPRAPRTHGDVKIALDRFYGDAENLVLPIGDAIWVFTSKTRGLPKAEIDERLRIVLGNASGNRVKALAQ